MLSTLLQFEGYILALLGIVFTGLFTVGGFAVRRYFVTHDTLGQLRAEDAKFITKMAQTVDKLTDRLVALEQRVNALPTETMFNNLNLKLAEFSGEQKAMQVKIESVQGGISGIERNVLLIQQHLLGGGK